MKIHDFKAFIIKLFNFTYNKCTLFVQNDINFAYENMMSESEFLLVYKNKAHTIFFLFFQFLLLCGSRKRKIVLEGGKKDFYKDKLWQVVEKQR